MSKRFFIYWVMIFGVLAPASQAFAGGSSFSSTRYGLWEYKPNPRVLGMGGMGIAMPSYYSLNMQNPAGLMGIPMTRYEMNMYAEWNDASNGGLNEVSNRATINHFAFAFPFGKTMAAAFNVSRLSSVNYDLKANDEVYEGHLYSERIIGEGGIQQAALTFAGKINRSLTVGFSAQYLFGNIYRHWRVYWPEGDFVDTRDKRVENLSGSRWVFGAIYSHDKWRYGAYAALASSVRGEFRTIGAYNDTTSRSNRSMDFPTEIGLGATYQWNKNYIAGLDLVYATWGSVPSLYESQKHQNTLRVSTGIERQPKTNLSARWWEKNFYRAGFMTQNLYATNNSGKFDNEFFFTLGIGVPFNRDRHAFDMALEMGQRGQIATSKIRDRVYRLTLSISGGERWFQNRQKRREEN